MFPICLGGNVFGWTADEPQSREVLDAWTRAGGKFIDTANSYLVEHGRSETIIGRWMADGGNRDQIVLATKVGGGRGAIRNPRAGTIEREAHASLERLQTDHIDLYYAHFDDEQTPLLGSDVWEHAYYLDLQQPPSGLPQGLVGRRQLGPPPSGSPR